MPYTSTPAIQPENWDSWSVVELLGGCSIYDICKILRFWTPSHPLVNISDIFSLDEYFTKNMICKSIPI